MHREGKVLPPIQQRTTTMNTIIKSTIGALAAATVGAQASVTLVAEYDTIQGPAGESIPWANTMVSVSATDLLTEELSNVAVFDGYNAGIAYTVTPTMGDDEAIRTLTIPKVLGGNYFVEYLNDSSVDIGLQMVINEGDNLFMYFSNANLSLVEGKTLEFVIYNDIGAGLDDLDFNQNLDIQTQSTYVAYSNGERAWDGGNGNENWTTITSSQNYAVPSEGFNGTQLPEPSSVLFITMATIPLIFRRKRTS